MMTLFVVVGVLCTIVGLVVLVTAIRHQDEQRPRYAAMLIGGMMMTAFGVVIAGFAIAYQRTSPLNVNSGAVQ